MKFRVLGARAVGGTISMAMAVAVASPAEARAKLDDIFTSDMLGAQVAYLETLTGVAWQMDAADRTYKVAGCVVTARTDKGAVKSLKLALTSRCTFDPNKMLSGWKLPSANKITFGSFGTMTGSQGRFYADCLGTTCGNSYVPAVYYHYEGGHAENWVQVNLEVGLLDDAPIDASSTWEDAMEKKFGLDYVQSGKFNCDASLNAVAVQAFAPVKITAIEIGSDLTTPTCW